MAPLIVLITLLFLSRWAIKRAFRAWTRRDDAVLNGGRCRCGYDLSNLTLARCPECGRVCGFESTAESLGLTEDELKRMAEAKARRDALADDVRATPVRKR